MRLSIDSATLANRFSRTWPLVLLATAVVCGGALRVKTAAQTTEITGQNYYHLGLNLRREGVLAYPANTKLPTAYRAPLYPVLVATMLDPRASFPRRQINLQAALGILAIPAIYVLGSATLGPLPAALGALLYAFDPVQIRACSSLEVEFFYSLLLLGTACSLAFWTLRPSRLSALGAALAIGTSLNCRSPLALFPLVLLAACLFRATLRERLAGQGRLILLTFWIPLAPWIVRNYIHFRAFIPLERHAATYNFFTASEGMLGGWSREDSYSLAEVGDRTMGGMNQFEKNQALWERALANVISRPGTYVRSSLKRLFHILNLHPLATALALIGLGASWNNPGAYVLAVFAAYFIVVHALLAVEARYLVPLQPLMGLLSCACIVHCRRLKTLSSELRRLLEPAGPGLMRTVATAVAIGCLALLILTTRYLAAELRQPGLQDKEILKANAEGFIPAPDPNESEGHYFNNRGVQRYLDGNISGAAADFERAISAAPKFPDPYLNLAAVSTKRNNHPRSLELCRKAARLTDSREGLNMHLSALQCQAEALGSLGRSREARAVWEERRESTVRAAGELRGGYVNFSGVN